MLRRSHEDRSVLLYWYRKLPLGSQDIGCEQCLARIQWCPQEAIQFGKKTPRYERYRHPEITLQDMIAAQTAQEQRGCCTVAVRDGGGEIKSTEQRSEVEKGEETMEMKHRNRGENRGLSRRMFLKIAGCLTAAGGMVKLPGIASAQDRTDIISQNVWEFFRYTGQRFRALAGNVTQGCFP